MADTPSAVASGEEDWIEVVEETKKALAENPKNVQAYFTQGTAYFKLEEYETSVRVLSDGLKVAQASSSEEERGYTPKFMQWIRKCNTNLTPDKQCVVEDVKPPAAVSSSSAVSPVQPPAKPPATSVRHDWYQTASTVYVSFFVKDRTDKDVEVTIENSSLEVCVRLGEGKEYQHRFSPLFSAVNPAASSHTLTKNKIEVKLQKVKEIHWKTLEGVEATEAPPAVLMNPTPTPAAVPAAPPAYPSSAPKKTNWDALNAVVEKEESEEKLEGDAALNKMFRQIYSRADEDTRRAMNKSFTESGGTVLSTNWSEIGAKKTEGKPPEGLEFYKPE